MKSSQIIGAVIVARMKSSRFPGKSMVDICGKPSLEWLVERIRLSDRIEKFTFATTTDPNDDVIENLAEKLGIACYRGSDIDVLGRVWNAAKVSNIDVVVHVTGDCPLLDPKLVDQVVDSFVTSKSADYVSLDPDSYPRGLDVEVFSVDALSRVEAEFSDPWIREHVTEPFYTMPNLFSAIRLSAPPSLYRPEYRVTIDTEEDYQLVREIFAYWLPRQHNFGAQEIVELLDARPDLVNINLGTKQTKYRAAVVGLGAIGAGYDPEGTSITPNHADTYLRYGKTRLTAACDPDPDRRNEFIRRFGVESVYATVDDLFRDEELSIVSIATPPDTHAELCLKAINAGITAIICEKPFVTDLKTGAEIVEASQQQGVLIAVNHWMRWSSRYSHLKDMITSGALGEVQTVRCQYSKGALNSGTHAVDLLRYLVGEISSVQATEYMELDTNDPNIGGVLHSDVGLPLRLEVSDYRDDFIFEIDVTGSRGRVRLTDQDAKFWIVGSGSNASINTLKPSPIIFPEQLGSPFEKAIAQLIAYLDNGHHDVECTAIDGLRAVQTIEALRISWQASGAIVPVR